VKASPDKIATPPAPPLPESARTLPVPVGSPAAPRADAGAPPDTVAAGSASQVEDIVRRALPAVVSLRSGNVSGSGFFVTDDMLVTNEHVVSGHTEVLVRLYDGSQQIGRVVTRQAAVDLATVRVERSSGRHGVLTLGRLGDVRVGQEVLAIGSPLGIDNTVTRGIVSGLRTVTGITLLQTDAAINPGNSGGPLLDRRGLVIGITTMKLMRAEQLAFAVAVDYAIPLLEGRQSVLPTQSSLASLVPGVRSDDQPSELDVARVRADRMFSTSLTRCRKLTEEFAANFDRYTAACAGRRTDWLVPFGSPGGSGTIQTANESTPTCRILWSDVTAAAQDIKAMIRDIEERARQAGVLPGVMRDLLERYGLEEVAAAANR